MNEFLLYLVKSACWLTGFSLVYFLFLRNERFFILKRIFLITGIVASIFFPLISVHYQVDLPSPQTSPVMVQEILPETTGIPQDIAGNTFDFRLILLLIYIAGIAFMGYRMIRQILSLYRSISRNKIDKQDSAVIVRSTEFPEAFSFFNYVFINPSVNEHEATEIMNHELVHVAQRHWFDLIMAEILRLLQWVNPVAWIYTGFIRLNLEFLADETALQRSSNPALYRAALINQLFDSPVISLSNSFNYSLNRKRFEMMKKIITSPYRKLRVLIVLPVFAIILFAFAVPEYSYLPASETITGPSLHEGLTPSTDQFGDTTRKTLPASETITGQSLREGLIPFTEQLGDTTRKTHPLIIIDGKETSLESAEGIDNASVEMMAVLKDESAINVFGEKGKNGVIIIKMKNPTPSLSDNNKIIKEVKGNILKEDDTAFIGVAIVVTGNQARTHSDESGSFTLSDVPGESHIIFSFRGYLTQVLKPAEKMTVKMQKDPDYRETSMNTELEKYKLSVNGVLSEKKYSEIRNEIDPQNIAKISILRAESAEKKYGENGKNGVVEIFTKDKAKEMGIDVPLRRSKPGDFPTFTGNSEKNFTQWVIDQLKYPDEAAQKGVQGRVSVSFVIQPDGLVSNIGTTGDPLLAVAVAGVVNSSPKWEPAVNPEARQPFGTSINLKFQLPDKITTDNIFVVVEQMPEFPGGDKALLEYIRSNLNYPREALEQKIEGRVIVRFVVTAKGTVESATIIKGVHPLLDAESLRLVSTLSGWLPGAQGGKPVDVWYMVPVTFTLPGSQVAKNPLSSTGEPPFVVVDQMPMYPGGDGELLKTIAERTEYPQDAKALKIGGRVIVRFVVSKDGTVRDATVLRGVEPSLDNEALRVVNTLTGFLPGKQGGKAVDVYYMIPITFTIK